MRGLARLGFRIRESELRSDIFVPRYYDPAIDDRLEELESSHELVSIQELIDAGELELRQGNYVGKMHYGTGLVPYIRTSDIANWELRASPKHGVSDVVYAQFAAQQDVREMDVLLVHEGTYLIGTPCLITRFDTKILFQHHLAKMRALSSERISGALLMAMLLTPVVQRQIRARQFTADVIDSIVGRLPEVLLPLPATDEGRLAVTDAARQIFEGRAEARVQLAGLTRNLDEALRLGSADALEERGDDAEPSGLISFLGERTGFQAFRRQSATIRQDIFLPRYYDPETDAELRALEETCELVTIGQLADEGRVDLETGDEVGKLAYGSGVIPFVRTSDLGNWELKHDPKQLVSDAIFEQYAAKQSARAGDILVVRDGTYLVGTSSIVSDDDLPLLFSGGIYRVRVADEDDLDPYLLLALLNSRIVKRQFRDKQFTRDVIDTLGRRFEEVVLPIPRDRELADVIAFGTGRFSRHAPRSGERRLSSASRSRPGRSELGRSSSASVGLTRPMRSRTGGS